MRWKPYVVVACTLAVLPFALAQDKPEEKKKAPPKDGNELIVKPARTVEFDTDEGTWMSLDLSPDGKTIVFELLGDLYTMPASGGKAELLIGGMQFDFQPRFSPDGKKIAFVSDRSGAENLWMVDADGKNPKAITTGRKSGYASPAWSPDGNYVYASKSEGGLGAYKLVMVDVRGGTGLPAGAKISDPSRRGTNRMGAVTSPDGRFLYYAERQGLWTYDSRFPLWQIQRYDRQTGDSSVITNAQGSAMRPAISPDGKTLVYATRYRTGTALRARDLKTGEERWVAYPIDRDDQEAIASRDTVPGFCFTKDGTGLIMPLHGKIQRLEMATGKATVIPFQAHVKTDVGKSVHYDYKVDDSEAVKARIIRSATLSPDGKRLAFTAFNHIYTMDFPGGTPKRLTDEAMGEFDPSWSPDGSNIVFVCWSPMGGSVCKVSSSGGQATRLTAFPGYYSSPVFTPDGSKVVYLAGTTQDGLRQTLHQETHCFDLEANPNELGNIGANVPMDVFTMPAGGGAGTFVASSQGFSSLQFGKDPNRLYLVGGGGLSSIRLDGLDRRELIKVAGTGTGMFGAGQVTADDIRVSPDGLSAAASVQNRLYLLSIPPLGGDAIQLTAGAVSSVPIKKIAPGGGDYLGWSPDGKAVTWSLGNKFFRMPIGAEKPEATEIVVEAPRRKATGAFVLKGARIITMNGDTVIPKGDVVVKDGRIVYVGPKAEAVPAGAKVIDCSGKTISPGYVDVHSHWFGASGPKLDQSWGYLANLAYGVTTNRDPQSGTSDIYDYSDMIETGNAIGPRIFTTGPGVFSASGLDDLEQTKDFVRRYAEAYKTNTLKEYVTGDRLTRQQVLLACDEFKITPTCEGALDFKLNMTQMIDGFSGHEHSLPIQPLYKDIAQLVAQTNTFYTPTLLVNYGAPTGENYWFEHTDVATDPKLRRFVPDELLDTMVRRRANWVMDEEYGFSGIAAGCAKVVRSGGKVCIGSHGQLQGLGAHWEMWSLASGGMTPLEVLRCATINGAEAIGLAKDIGSVEPGKLADLVIYDKNPLENIRNTNTIRYVIRGGIVYMADTMDEIWPQNKPLGKIYYQNYGPAKTIEQ